MDYVINPVKMGGLVKEVRDSRVKLHLFGRLGVITVPETVIDAEEAVVPGSELAFYFSYIQVVKDPYDYDDAEMYVINSTEYCLLGGRIEEVNDTAIEIIIMNHLGKIAVPRRWVFTPVTPKPVFTELKKPLSECKVAFITAGGIHKKDQTPFFNGDPPARGSPLVAG